MGIKLKKWIIVILLIIMGIGFVLYKKHKVVNTTAGVSNYVLLNPSDIIEVKSGKVNDVVAFTGDLEPLNQTIISSQVDAQVTKVLVNEGELVTKGQTLAILDDDDLKQSVSKQQALLDSAIIKFNLSKNKLEKNKELLAEGFISKLGYDELSSEYQAATEEVNQQRAALVQAQKSLSETIIKAPFAGYIYQKSIDNGQLASKNGKLFSLASLDVLQITAAIPSDRINQINQQQLVTFTVEVDDKVYSGKITLVNPVAQNGTRSYLIYINFDNRVAKLKAGQFVKGQVILDGLDNVAYIPQDAIRNLQSTPEVLVLTADKVLLKPVKVLLTNSVTNISAVSGVVSGEKVIAGSVLSVKAGDLVKVE